MKTQKQLISEIESAVADYAAENEITENTVIAISKDETVSIFETDFNTFPEAKNIIDVEKLYEYQETWPSIELIAVHLNS